MQPMAVHRSQGEAKVPELFAEPLGETYQLLADAAQAHIDAMTHSHSSFFDVIKRPPTRRVLGVEGRSGCLH